MPKIVISLAIVIISNTLTFIIIGLITKKGYKDAWGIYPFLAMGLTGIGVLILWLNFCG